jgi:hypothetical protein
MAQTRGATGNAKPRVFQLVSTEPSRKRTTTKKSKANTSKRVASGSITKKAPAAPNKPKHALKDKAADAVEKVVSKVEQKSSKKAAGAKKIEGTDDKNARTKKAVV